MSKSVLVRSRILVVEDQREYMNYVLNCLDGITELEKKQKGISDFEVYQAETVEEAKRLLRESKTPFDLVLLDMRLPVEPGGRIDAAHGLALLNFIHESQKAKGVIIISVLTDYKLVVEGFHGGALDFVVKPFDVEVTALPTSILNALARLLAEESGRILNQRIRHLVAYAEVGLVHSFKVVFKDLDDGVTKAADGIERYVRERFGLDEDANPNDSLILQLRSHRKVVSKARRDWARLQAELIPGDKALNVSQLGRMIEDIKESLLPCLAVKRVAFDLTDFAERPVTTFEKDVEVVLREIIVGALSELPDYSKESQIKISVSTEDTLAVVKFEDKFEPLPEDKIEAINQWQRVLPDTEFGRAWGLSVVQHVALRGGGNLKVETERGRNVVTYKIPLADYV
jgi:FixJ family two-component response regulator